MITTTTGEIPVEEASERERAVGVLTAAFEADPALRWIYPDPAQYRTCFPRFVDVFAGAAWTHGTAFQTGEYQGVALWFPPEVAPDEDAIVALVEESVRSSNRSQVFALFEEMDGFHPHEPHWYLSLLGVNPAAQRRGYGSALLRPVLALCDRERLPAFLEASSPESARLYARHGFETLGTIAVATSPPLFPMWRPPQ